MKVKEVSTRTLAIRYFKAHGVVSEMLLMRKFKISYDVAKSICEYIQKRYPNLWEKGKEQLTQKT